MNGTPASLMTLFCTGAVTMARELAAPAAVAPRDRSAAAPSGALRTSSWPGTAGTASGSCSTRQLAGRRGSAPGAGCIVAQRARGAAAARARSRSKSRSARHTSGQSTRLLAIARHRSGPMPALSPQVRAMGAAGQARRSRLTRRPAASEPQFDVGLVAQLLQPQFGGLIDAAVAQLRKGLLALRVGGVVEVAAARASARCASRTAS